jgi:predicted transport protein
VRQINGLFLKLITNIGHWGVGDVEVAINKFEQLEIAKLLIKKSFDKNR